MRYKGCHEAHNAQVAICAFFTTPNPLKLQERRKAFSPIRKVRAISQKLYSHLQPPKIPAGSDARSHHTSRGFLHWRFAYAGPGVRRATFMRPASENLHNRRHMSWRIVKEVANSGGLYQAEPKKMRRQAAKRQDPAGSDEP